MIYLLDTNVCIALIDGRPPAARTRLALALAAGAELVVSAVAVFELSYGIGKSARPNENAERVERFLAGPISVLPFDREDAEAAGAIRSVLEKAGRPIGPFDLLMAGQAVRRNWTLVTANRREFSRVKGLVWEDWVRH
ncbi:MAG TPA: type II toxin-antitoxin system VapC family toxin [Candidatus Dormibacteraeota bacterium]|nr:type II toxin-antitoxin system VapC family toxin [Candidatus Dormibacteraeota bacterium]